MTMTTDQIQRNWNQDISKLRAQWGELSDEDLDRIETRRERILDEILAYYAIEDGSLGRAAGS